MAAYEAANRLRLLDYLGIHFYPQQAGVALSNDVSAAMQALRLRSTRALWDPTYTDESWIAETVQLVPRMKQIIAEIIQTQSSPLPSTTGVQLATSTARWPRQTCSAF